MPRRCKYPLCNEELPESYHKNKLYCEKACRQAWWVLHTAAKLLAKVGQEVAVKLLVEIAKG